MSEGLASLFRQAEWPAGWPGAEQLECSADPGLLLRLEAALFELDRFCRLPISCRSLVVTEFGRATRALSERLGTGIVAPSLASEALHEATLATLNLSSLPSMPDFATAQRWHRVLAARGLRLAKPVKCVHHPLDGWAGTLRISLSMPLICQLAALDQDALTQWLSRDMSQIADVLEAAQRTVVA